MLLINGSEPDFMMATSAATFDMIDNLPAFYGARHNAGHTATVFHPGGGEFANVASNWLHVDVQRRQESRHDVRRQELRPLHEFELGREIERDQGMKSQIALAVVAGCAAACCLRAESFVFVSSRQQHAELAESGNQERAREVQESAEAVLDSRCRPVGECERSAAGSGPSSHGRNSRRARRRAVVESGLVVGGQ